MKLVQMYRHRQSVCGLRLSLEPDRENTTYGTCPANGLHGLTLLDTGSSFNENKSIFYVLQERKYNEVI